MKKVMHGDNLQEPFIFEIPDNKNQLEYIINMENEELNTIPTMITKRVHGFEKLFNHINRGKPMQFIYEEYTTGKIGEEQHYSKHEYYVSDVR
jgi:hypothetical protein